MLLDIGASQIRVSVFDGIHNGYVICKDGFTFDLLKLLEYPEEKPAVCAELPCGLFEEPIGGAGRDVVPEPPVFLGEIGNIGGQDRSANAHQTVLQCLDVHR